MAKVAAGITTSLDGYITGANDGPGRDAHRLSRRALTGGGRWQD
jgi:hypothetical protein